MNSLAVAVQILWPAQIYSLVDGELEFVVGEVRVAHDPRVGAHLVVKLGDCIPAFGSVSVESNFFGEEVDALNKRILSVLFLPAVLKTKV